MSLSCTSLWTPFRLKQARLYFATKSCVFSSPSISGKGFGFGLIGFPSPRPPGSPGNYARCGGLKIIFAKHVWEILSTIKSIFEFVSQPGLPSPSPSPGGALMGGSSSLSSITSPNPKHPPKFSLRNPAQGFHPCTIYTPFWLLVYLLFFSRWTKCPDPSISSSSSRAFSSPFLNWSHMEQLYIYKRTYIFIETHLHI